MIVVLYCLRVQGLSEVSIERAGVHGDAGRYCRRRGSVVVRMRVRLLMIISITVAIAMAMLRVLVLRCRNTLHFRRVHGRRACRRRCRRLVLRWDSMMLLLCLLLRSRARTNRRLSDGFFLGRLGRER